MFRGFLDWIDSRSRLVTAVKAIVSHDNPINFNYWWNFGSLAGLCLILQIVTGIFLAMHYVPNALHAFNSVEHIMRDVHYGWLFRYMHMNGASLFFIVVYVHMFRGIYYGSYKPPRDFMWIVGVVIFLLMMATAFMGYVLPWGQMSFWGATVITNLFSAIPLVGDYIVKLLWGGYSVGNPTLNRFFALHYLLPFLIIGVAFIHVLSLHTVGAGNPAGVDPKTPKEKAPLSWYLRKDLVTAVPFFGVLFLVMWINPEMFNHADNYIPANPMVTPPHIVPEWYFLPFYAILRAIPNKLLGVIAMFGSILILIGLPIIDRSPVRSGKYRSRYFRYLFWVFLCNGILLGYVGSQAPEGIFVPLGQLATAIYFGFFPAVHFIGKTETEDMNPKSITEDLARSK